MGHVNPAWFIHHYLNIQEVVDSKVHTYPPFPDFVLKWTGLRDGMREAEMYQPIVSNSRLDSVFILADWVTG